MTLYKNKYRIESSRLPGWDYSSPGYYFVTICTHNREHVFGEIKNGEMVLNKYGSIVDNEWKQTFKIRPLLEPDVFVVMQNHFHCIVHITNRGNRVNVDNGDDHDRDGDVNNDCDGNGDCDGNNVVETPCHGVSTPGTAITPGTTPGTGIRTAISMDTPTNPQRAISGTEINKIPPDTTPELPQTTKQRENINSHPNNWKSGVLGAIIGQFKIKVTKRIRKNGYPGFNWQYRFHDHIVRNDLELFRIREYIRNNPSNWENDSFNRQCMNRVNEELADYEQEIWMV